MVINMAVHTTAEKMGTTQYDTPNMLTELIKDYLVGEGEEGDV